MNSLMYLLEVYADGSITEDEAAELISLLESEPEELQKAKETLKVHGMILEHSRFDLEGDELVNAVSRSVDFSKSPGTFEKAVLNKTEKLSRQRKLIMYLPLAASLFIIAGVWLWKGTQAVDPKTVQTSTETEPGIVKVIAQENAQWRQDRDGEQVGENLVRGSYKLIRGTVVLKTDSGSIITMKVPVEFELLNAERLYLNEGELGVRIAKGSTYSVDTSEMMIVDLGTEFAVRSVPEKTSLYVFDGEVGVFTTSKSDESKMDSLRVKEGRGLEYEPGQQFVLTNNNFSKLEKPSDIYSQFQSKEYFVIDLAGKHPQKLNKLVIHNYGQEESGYNYYSKDFTVQIAENSKKNFKTVYEGTLNARTGSQSFDIPPIEGRFIKLIIKSGYQDGFLELSEFAVFNTDGKNVAAASEGGKLFDFHSDYPHEIEKGHWVAANIIDGKTKGHASDSWSSNGKALFDEFLTVKLAGEGSNRIDRLTIYNYGQEEGGYNYYSKDFTVMVSTTTMDSKAFKFLHKGLLKPQIGPQSFPVKATDVKYVKLIINSGYRTGFVELGELEVYTAEGSNIAAAKEGGTVMEFSSQDPRRLKLGFWKADNLIDGEKSSPGGSWCSDKLLPTGKEK